VVLSGNVTQQAGSTIQYGTVERLEFVPSQEFLLVSSSSSKVPSELLRVNTIAIS
jgi:hypothetical protein